MTYFVKFVLCRVVNSTSLFISGACSQVDVVLLENPLSELRTLKCVFYSLYCYQSGTSGDTIELVSVYQIRHCVYADMNSFMRFCFQLESEF